MRTPYKTPRPHLRRDWAPPSHICAGTVHTYARRYGYLEPTLWKETRYMPVPYQEFTDYLSTKAHTRGSRH